MNNIYFKQASIIFSVLSSALIMTNVQANSTPKLGIEFTSKRQVNQNEFAFVQFAGDSMMSSIISNNLNSTQLSLTKKYLPELAYNSEQVLRNITLWQQLGVPYAVVGETSSNGGSVVVEYEVIDLVNKRVIQGKQTAVTSANPQNMRRTAHAISDDIYKKITGTAGDFSGRIAYVEEQGEGNNKVSSLKITDSALKNHTVLFQKKGSIFSPAWSPDGQNIAFSHQAPNGLPVIYVQNIKNGQPMLITPFKGDNLSPSFSPIDNSILFSSTFEGNTDIYRYSFGSSRTKKIVSLPTIENQPSYAPDGRSFLFISSKSGEKTPQIYRYTFSTGSIDRVTSGVRKGTPSYSPDGTKIAFLNGNSAAIMNANGSGVYNIANTGKDEAPHFSSNGTRVVYSSIKNGKGVINIHSLNGGKKISIGTNGIVHSPVWSNPAR